MFAFQPSFMFAFQASFLFAVFQPGFLVPAVFLAGFG